MPLRDLIERLEKTSAIRLVQSIFTSRDTQAPLDSGTNRAGMFHPSIHEGTKAPYPQYDYAGGGF